MEHASQSHDSSSQSAMTAKSSSSQSAVKTKFSPLEIGTTLQLEAPHHTEEHRFYVRILGWAWGKSLIIAPPEERNWAILLKADTEVKIRGFTGDSVIAFITHVLCVHSVPYDHIHLAFPHEVEVASVRTAVRTQVEFEGEVTAGDKATLVKVVDLSVAGARITGSSDLGDIGDDLILNLAPEVGGEKRKVSVSATIRNKRSDDKLDAIPDSSYYGLQFQPLEKEQLLVVSSFLYEQLARNKINHT